MYQIKSCLDFPTPGAPLTLMEGLGGGGGGVRLIFSGLKLWPKGIFGVYERRWDFFGSQKNSWIFLGSVLFVSSDQQ